MYSSGLILYTIQFEIDVPLNERKDVELFIPDGVNIAFIKSNFGKLYHPDWMHLKKQPKVKTSARGRPKIIKPPKINKKNNGSNDEFSSAITFGVINESDVFSVKIFHVKSGNIPGMKTDNTQLVEKIVNKVFNFINYYRPQTNIRLTNIKLSLKNRTYHFDFSNYPDIPNPTINLYLLKERTCGLSNNTIYINTGPDYKTKSISGTESGDKIDIFFSNKHVYAKCIYVNKSENNKIYHTSLYPDGKLFLYGASSNDDICNKISTGLFNFVIENNDRTKHMKHQIIQTGYTIKKTS